jgi:hypothetical protein
MTELKFQLRGEPDDPILVTSAAFNQPAFANHVHKGRREDLELFSALHALAYHGLGRHPLGVGVRKHPKDSPDRTLASGDRTWGTELTQLTVTSTLPPTPRQQMDQAIKFRERLQQRIESHPVAYSHLAGRAVTIHKSISIPANPAAEAMPKKDGSLLNQIAYELRRDKGVMSVGQPTGQTDRGVYGNHGPLAVTVQAIQGITGFAVYLTYDFPVRRSEALAAFAERVAEKDELGNEIVIITCGVPDENGWTRGSDNALYQHLVNSSQSGIYPLPKKPTHIRGLLIHESPESHAIRLLSSNDDLPWRVTTGSHTLIAPPQGPLFQRAAT